MSVFVDTTILVYAHSEGAEEKHLVEPAGAGALGIAGFARDQRAGLQGTVAGAAGL